MFIDTISGKFLADAENSYEICYKVAPMQWECTYIIVDPEGSLIGIYSFTEEQG